MATPQAVGAMVPMCGSGCVIGDVDPAIPAPERPRRTSSRSVGASRATRGYLRDRDRVGPAAARGPAAPRQAGRRPGRARYASTVVDACTVITSPESRGSRTASSVRAPGHGVQTIYGASASTRTCQRSEGSSGSKRQTVPVRMRASVCRRGAARRASMAAMARRNAFCTEVRARSSASVKARDRPPGRTTRVSSSSSASNSARRAEARSMSAYASASSISRWRLGRLLAVRVARVRRAPPAVPAPRPCRRAAWRARLRRDE